MVRRNLKETIFIKVDDEFDYQINGDDPFIPLHLDIRTKSGEMSSVMTAKPDRLDIHRVTLRYLISLGMLYFVSEFLVSFC